MFYLGRPLFQGKISLDFKKGTKKRDTAVSPTFNNLKSNTMKNTMQRYGSLANLQELCAKTFQKRVFL